MSEKIKIQCPGCQASLKITEKHFGKTFRCPSCQIEIRVRSADTPAPAQEPVDLAAYANRQPTQPTQPTPQPQQPAPTEPPADSYWKAAGSAATQKFQPQTRTEKFKAANQRKKQKEGDESEFGALFRVGGFMVILGFAGAVLPFIGFELKVGGPLVALFIGLVGCVLIAIALRDQLMVAIGSAVGGGLILSVFCITSHYANYVDPAPVANNAPRPNAVAQKKKQNQQPQNQQPQNRQPQNQAQNKIANKQPQKSRIERLIDDSVNRAPVQSSPFRNVVATTSNSTNPNQNTVANNNASPNNPFGNFDKPVDTTPAHSIPKSTNSSADKSDPFGMDEPKNENPFGVVPSRTPPVTTEKVDENPIGIVESGKSKGEENPFKVDGQASNTEKGEKNPFATDHSSDATDANPIQNTPVSTVPRVVKKLTKAEEEELCESRYSDGIQLERGKPLDESLGGGLSMTAPVGKIQLIGKAMHDNRPVVGVALGQAVGRTMVFPIYEGDKQFSSEVRAPQGSYLAGLHIGFEEGALTGVQAVFATRTGQGLNMQNKVESEWLGKKPRRSLMKRLYAKDSMVHGITVFQKAADIWGVGLVVD